MPLSLTVTTAPTSEPLTLSEVKDHLRVDADDQDAGLAIMLQAAREYAEAYQNRALMPQTLRLKLDRFPCSYEQFAGGEFQPVPCLSRRGNAIVLPRAPLTSVTGITYVDTNGTTQTLSTSVYTVDTDSEPGRILLAYGQSWPSLRCQANAVTITYVAGYATAALVPAKVKHAMLMLVAHWWENREAVLVGSISKDLEFAVSALLGTDRVWEL